MKAFCIGLMFAAVSVPAFANCICLSSRDKCPSPQVVEFVMNQNLSSETVTCAAYFGVYDFNQAGHIEGTGCTATGPLILDNGTQGNVNVTFTFTDGTTENWSGCRIDDTSIFPGYTKVGINCT
jgi:hypothetical protein